MNSQYRKNLKAILEACKQYIDEKISGGEQEMILEVASITGLTNSQCQDLSCGDVVVENNNGAKTTYIVFSKTATTMSLTYVDSTNSKEVKYEVSNNAWAYDETVTTALGGKGGGGSANLSLADTNWILPAHYVADEIDTDSIMSAYFDMVSFVANNLPNLNDVSTGFLVSNIGYILSIKSNNLGDIIDSTYGGYHLILKVTEDNNVYTLNVCSRFQETDTVIVSQVLDVSTDMMLTIGEVLTKYDSELFGQTFQSALASWFTDCLDAIIGTGSYSQSRDVWFCTYNAPIGSYDGDEKLYSINEVLKAVLDITI